MMSSSSLQRITILCVWWHIWTCLLRGSGCCGQSLVVAAGTTTSLTSVSTSASSASSSSSFPHSTGGGNNIRRRPRQLEDNSSSSSNNNNNDPSTERCLRDKEWSERTEIGVECLCKSAPTLHTSTSTSTSANSSNSSSSVQQQLSVGSVLVCSDQCTFCNDDRSVCGIKSTEALYDRDTGSRIGVGMVYEYIKLGPIQDQVLMLASSSTTTSEPSTTATTQQQQQAITVYDVQLMTPMTTTAGTTTSAASSSTTTTSTTTTTTTVTAVSLALEELDCIEDNDTEELLSCGSCSVYLGGVPCTSCIVKDCGGGGDGDGDDDAVFAPVMDCSNLQEGAIFDFCELVEMDITNSLFQAFQRDQFVRCLPMNELSIPSSTDTTSSGTAADAAVVDMTRSGPISSGVEQSSSSYWNDYYDMDEASSGRVSS